MANLFNVNRAELDKYNATMAINSCRGRYGLEEEVARLDGRFVTAVNLLELPSIVAYIQFDYILKEVHTHIEY